jgi:TonB-linked SusC/RagA family outer membrane protein
MKKYLFIIVAALMTLSVQAQNRLSGKVTSATDGEPMVGVTVMVKGQQGGAVTDINGEYNISTSSNAMVTYSMIGFKSQTIKRNGRNVINVSLAEDVKSVDDVVVIGYGVAKKSDLTSSISSVKGDEITQAPAGNAMISLQGKVNGVQIVNSGSPGDVPRVIIRGVTTVNGSDPLYVVDGMPMGTDINFLNPNDIESMEVLKDASASAIYGTRGSNGVILITTKKGKAGKTVFHVDTSLGFQTIKNPNMAKASEYEKVFKQRYINDGYDEIPYYSKDNITDAEGTDWWNETVNKVALVQSYNIGFQGGNDKFTFSGSLGYFRQDSQYDVGYWDKITGRFNSEYKFNRVVKVGMDFAPKYERWYDTPSLFDAAMRMDPTTPIFIDESKWTDNEYSNYSRSHNSQVWNPVASLARQDSHNFVYAVVMTPYINIEPVKDLNIRSQFGVNARFRTADSYSPNFFIDNLEKNDQSDVSRSMNTWVDWDWNNTINWMHTFNKVHNLNVMGGFTMEKFSNYWLSGSRENTPNNSEALRYVSAGTLNQQTSGTNSYSTLLSYLGRVMYNYAGRYYLTASLRVDGSSKFPAGNRYATFPSVSAAWRITEEPFMKNQHIFENLKLRLGWGRVGNQNIDSNAYLTLIGSSDYVFGSGALRTLGTCVSNIGNTNLKWETVEDYDAGVDMTFLHNRLNVTFDVYQKKSHDMLLQKDNLLVLGYPMWNGQMWTNIGKMQATGWEASVNWNDRIADFGYELGVNISAVKNKAVTLLGSDAPIYRGGFYGDYIIKNEEGGEISRFFGYKTDGLFQNQTEINSYTSENGTLLQPKAKVGDIRFVDLNHDGVIDAKDKTWIGNAFPDFTLGFNSHFTYKNFDLVMNFYGSFGNDIFNRTKNLYSGLEGANVYAGTYDKAWHGEGTSYDLPRLSANDDNNNYKTVSDFFVEDGSYMRCKLLQLGYTLPKSITKIFVARFSVSAQNLFTITNYKGMDPERAAMGSVVESGIDNIGYPNPRTFLFGCNITF